MLIFPKSRKAAIYARVVQGALKAQKLQTSQLYNIAPPCGYQTEQMIVYLEEEVSERDMLAERQCFQELLHKVDMGTIHSILGTTEVRRI